MCCIYWPVGKAGADPIHLPPRHPLLACTFPVEVGVPYQASCYTAVKREIRCRRVSVKAGRRDALVAIAMYSP